MSSFGQSGSPSNHTACLALTYFPGKCDAAPRLVVVGAAGFARKNKRDPASVLPHLEPLHALVALQWVVVEGEVERYCG